MIGLMIGFAIFCICAAMACNMVVGRMLRLEDRYDLSGMFLLYSPLGALAFLLLATFGSSLSIASILAIPALVAFVIMHWQTIYEYGSTFEGILGLISNAICVVFLIYVYFNWA